MGTARLIRVLSFLEREVKLESAGKSKFGQRVVDELLVDEDPSRYSQAEWKMLQSQGRKAEGVRRRF